MTDLALKKKIEKLLGDKIDKETVLFSHTFEILEDKFGFDECEICSLVEEYPKILTANYDALKSSLDYLGKYINLRSNEVKSLFLKRPSLVVTRGELLLYKFRLLCKTLDISLVESIKLVFLFPALLNLTKSGVIDQINLISRKLKLFEFSIRKQFRLDPRLIFVKEESIDWVLSFLKNDLKFSNDDALSVVRRYPDVLSMSSESLNEFYSFMTERGFNKTDLRQMIFNVPALLGLDMKIFDRKLETIKQLLSVNEAKAKDFLRRAPKTLIEDEAVLNLKALLDLTISKNYVLSFPKILSEPFNSIKIKFILTRVMNLDKHFDNIVEQPLTQVVSKFIYLINIGLSDFSDMLLSQDEFLKKYNIKNEDLKKYTFDIRTLSRVLQFYSSNNGKLDFDTDSILRFLDCREENFIANSDLRCETFDLLVDLGFSKGEADYILNVNQSITFFGVNSISKVFEVLKKYCQAEEDVIKLVLFNPTLLSFSPRDLIKMIEISSNKDDILKTLEVL